MAEIDLELRDLQSGLPHLCMLCGRVPAEPSTPLVLAPVPRPLKVFAPLANALHPSRQWLKAPLCPSCQSAYQRGNLVAWAASLTTLAAAGMGVFGLARGAAVTSSLPGLILAAAIPVLYLLWTVGPGRSCHLHCSGIDSEHLTLRVPNIDFPKTYLAVKREARSALKSAAPAILPPRVVENPEVVEAAPDPTSPYLTGESLARIPEELTPFMLAVKEGEFEKIDKFLKSGASWEETTPEGLYPIHIATLVGASDTVAHLMTLGQSLSQRAPHGLTPMHLAVQCNYAQLVGLMLARKMDPNCSNDDGQTPLHWACATADPRLGGTPRYKMIKQLLAAGANPGLKDAQGRTPGDLAAAMGHGEALEALGLKAEASVPDEGGS
jgi:hypothetical protein